MASLFERLDKGRPPPTKEAPPTEEATPVANIFQRLDKGQQPPPTEEASKRPPRDLERLTNWLINNWTKDTITAREIYMYGPCSIRDKRTTLNLAEILVERGQLVPTKPRRHDMHEWQIAAKRSEA